MQKIRETLNFSKRARIGKVTMEWHRFIQHINLWLIFMHRVCLKRVKEQALKATKISDIALLYDICKHFNLRYRTGIFQCQRSFETYLFEQKYVLCHTYFIILLLWHQHPIYVKVFLIYTGCIFEIIDMQVLFVLSPEINKECNQFKNYLRDWIPLC